MDDGYLVTTFRPIEHETKPLRLKTNTTREPFASHSSKIPPIRRRKETLGERRKETLGERLQLSPTMLQRRLRLRTAAAVKEAITAAAAAAEPEEIAADAKLDPRDHQASRDRTVRTVLTDSREETDWRARMAIHSRPQAHASDLAPLVHRDQPVPPVHQARWATQERPVPTASQALQDPKELQENRVHPAHLALRARRVLLENQANLHQATLLLALLAEMATTAHLAHRAAQA